MATQYDQFRQLVGEIVPPDGTAADTLFTDEQIAAILQSAGGNMNRAVYEGWRIKAAHFAGLVDVTDGNASRAMSDLVGQAEKMMKYYSKTSGNFLTDGRTRIGRIVRR